MVRLHKTSAGELFVQPAHRTKTFLLQERRHFGIQSLPGVERDFGALGIDVSASAKDGLRAPEHTQFETLDIQLQQDLGSVGPVRAKLSSVTTWTRRVPTSSVLGNSFACRSPIGSNEELSLRRLI